MKKQIIWGSDEIFIQNYLTLKSSRKMGVLYNCTKNSIIRHCKDIGFDYTVIQYGQLSEDDKKKIISEYNTKTSVQLAEEYGVSRGIITKIWYDNNLKGKPRDYSNAGNNLMGMTFGYLTVIDTSKKRSSNGNKYWLCSCSCGRENCLHTKEINGDNLLSGLVISCGTISRENLDKGRGRYNDLSGMKFGKLTVIERDTLNSHTNIKSGVIWKCICECGNITYVLASNLVIGNTKTCGLCSTSSRGNRKIEQILKEHNISFVREKRFQSCKDKMVLPFDFYVDNKYCIEFDGKYHYVETTFFDHEGAVRRDKIKSQWCKDNNIPLIRIPYTQFDLLCIEDLLLETSSFIETNADIKSQD